VDQTTDDAAGTVAGTGRRRRTLTVTATLLLAVVLGVGGTIVISGSGERAWPRPFDPAKGIDISGVPGVSAEQEQRARELIEASLAAAPLWEDFEKTKAAGWGTIADATTGYEHLMNPAMFLDGRFLDPEHPEAIVYKVDGEKRILQAFMFMADPGVRLDDPELTGFAGRLVEWHNHSNLCGVRKEDDPVGKVAGLKTPSGGCLVPGATDDFGLDIPGAGIVAVGSFSMTHVWIAPNACGPFAAVAVKAVPGLAEGVTLTDTDDRVDLCRHD
jgi:hypothetical protein